jgi:hypothetical protein
MELNGPLCIFVAEGPRNSTGVMRQKGQDAWEKAAACEGHALRTNDGKLQEMFRKLRDSWIRIANNAQFASDVAANEKRLDEEKR